MRKILIVTHPQDAHSFLVQEGLQRKGAEVVLVHTSDFPRTLRKSLLRTAAEEPWWTLDGPELSLRGFHPEVLWWRRPVGPLLPEWLHEEDRKFAEYECRYFFNAFWESFVEDECFWVNPYSSRYSAENKILQHRAATAAGFVTPPTLYGNDPGQIRAFLRDNGMQAVYKSFRAAHHRWPSESGAPRFLFTSIVREEMLPPDEVLAVTPGIFQAVVAKDYELRVVAIGRKLFAAKINSQQTEHGRLDWRSAYNEIELEPTDLPKDVAQSCLAVLDNLGIVFGSFDLIVTPEGQHVFLEINPGGQFLWVEDYTGLPLLDAFCEFLLQRDVNFRWRETPSCIRLSEVEEAAERRREEAARLHVLAHPPTPLASCS